MVRISFLAALLCVACGSDPQHPLPDAALHDAGHDAALDAAGSGSNAVASIVTHPHDHKLELLVVGLCVVVVAGPMGSRRRRDQA